MVATHTRIISAKSEARGMTMKVKIKEKGQKSVLVDVNHRDCPKRPCFYYGHYTHYSAAGASGCSHWTDKDLSCLQRDNHGCPKK
jgi:hypothetical protein